MGLDPEHRVVSALGQAQQVVAKGVALVDPGLGQRCHGKGTQDGWAGRLAKRLAEVTAARINRRDLGCPIAGGGNQRHTQRGLQVQLASVPVVARWQRRQLGETALQQTDGLHIGAHSLRDLSGKAVVHGRPVGLVGGGEVGGDLTRDRVKGRRVDALERVGHASMEQAPACLGRLRVGDLADLVVAEVVRAAPLLADDLLCQELIEGVDEDVLIRAAGFADDFHGKGSAHRGGEGRCVPGRLGQLTQAGGDDCQHPRWDASRGTVLIGIHQPGAYHLDHE